MWARLERWERLDTVTLLVVEATLAYEAEIETARAVGRHGASTV